MSVSKLGGEESKEPEQRFQCDKCLHSYSTVTNLRRHQLEHETKYKCPCGAVFTTKQYLGEHKKGVHGSGFKCKLCGDKVSFLTKTALISHQNREHGNKYQVS